jgi:tRNA(fMet)-specific endonuclease VapC
MILLDTDVVSQMLRPNPPRGLARRLRQTRRTDRFISTISVGELLYGIERTGRHEDVRMRLETHFLPWIGIAPFDLESARAYGYMKAELHKAGQPLPEPDLRIASVAIAHGLTLVTGNEAHFRRVRGLKIENWLRG